MNRVLKLVIAVAGVSVASVATVAAQGAHFGVGGGLTSPLSDFKDQDKTGWHGLARVDLSIPLSPVAVRVDGMYAQTSHQATYSSDGNTKLIGGLASVVWKVPVPAPMVKPYVLAGGGVYNVKTTAPSLSLDTAVTKFAYAFGAGVNLGAGPLHLFVEGRYVSIQTEGKAIKFVPVTAGVMFGAGK